MRNILPPSADLFEKIMGRIERERRWRVVRWKAIVFGLLAALSGAALIPALAFIKAELSESGFAQFLSLLSSDFLVMLSDWQSFTYALLESLPVISIAAALGALFVLLFSLQSLSKNIRYGTQ